MCACTHTYVVSMCMYAIKNCVCISVYMRVYMFALMQMCISVEGFVCVFCVGYIYLSV